jgi:hypothetical protein
LVAGEGPLASGQLLVRALLARAQERALASGQLLARALAAREDLTPLFAAPPGDAVVEEGWILGAGHSALLAEASAWP